MLEIDKISRKKFVQTMFENRKRTRRVIFVLQSVIKMSSFILCYWFLKMYYSLPYQETAMSLLFLIYATIEKLIITFFSNNANV